MRLQELLENPDDAWIGVVVPGLLTGPLLWIDGVPHNVTAIELDGESEPVNDDYDLYLDEDGFKYEVDITIKGKLYRLWLVAENGPPANRTRWNVLYAFEALGAGQRQMVIQAMGWINIFSPNLQPHLLLDSVTNFVLAEGMEAEFITKCTEVYNAT